MGISVASRPLLTVFCFPDVFNLQGFGKVLRPIRWEDLTEEDVRQLELESDSEEKCLGVCLTTLLTATSSFSCWLFFVFEENPLAMVLLQSRPRKSSVGGDSMDFSLFTRDLRSLPPGEAQEKARAESSRPLEEENAKLKAELAKVKAERDTKDLEVSQKETLLKLYREGTPLPFSCFW